MNPNDLLIWMAYIAVACAFVVCVPIGISNMLGFDLISFAVGQGWIKSFGKPKSNRKKKKKSRRRQREREYESDYEDEDDFEEEDDRDYRYRRKKKRKKKKRNKNFYVNNRSG